MWTLKCTIECKFMSATIATPQTNGRDCKPQREKAPHGFLPSDANINAALCTRATPHINGNAVLAIPASGFISRVITSWVQSQGSSEA